MATPDRQSRQGAYINQIFSLLATPTLLRATFAGTARFAKSTLHRAALRPIELAEGRRLQLSRFDGRKVLYSNHTADELPAALAEVLGAGFSNVHVSTTTEEIDLRLTMKGDLLIGRKPNKARVAGVPRGEVTGVADVAVAVEPHNRTKEVPLPEGRGDVLMEAMGILDRNGRVRPRMRDKFTQINEFLKLLEHVLPEARKHRRDADATGAGTLLILDCGCGSSLLTLATAHFLSTVKKIPARVVGIDQNGEVIAKSRARAAEVPGLQIEFRQAAIGQIADLRADIVLALHACDTATDDALVQAVRSEARLVLAVPCCHKELNGRLQIAALAAVHRQGILHQRQADIVTDTFRALLLEVMGYRAEVIEFISAEHTARNLMIRAVRVRGVGAEEAVARYAGFKAFCGVTPYLERALGDLLPAALRGGASVSL